MQGGGVERLAMQQPAGSPKHWTELRQHGPIELSDLMAFFDLGETRFRRALYQCLQDQEECSAFASHAAPDKPGGPYGLLRDLDYSTVRPCHSPQIGKAGGPGVRPGVRGCRTEGL